MLVNEQIWNIFVCLLIPGLGSIQGSAHRERQRVPGCAADLVQPGGEDLRALRWNSNHSCVLVWGETLAFKTFHQEIRHALITQRPQNYSIQHHRSNTS